MNARARRGVAGVVGTGGLVSAVLDQVFAETRRGIALVGCADVCVVAVHDRCLTGSHRRVAEFNRAWITVFTIDWYMRANASLTRVIGTFEAVVTQLDFELTLARSLITRVVRTIVLIVACDGLIDTITRLSVTKFGSA